VELKWWPVAIAGLICLGLAVGLAALLPMEQVRRRLRPMGHVNRLTRLPEYIRIVRLQFWSMLVAVVLLVTVFLAALLASSRPVGSRDFDTAHLDDIMLCVGAPVTDPTTAGLLNHFARQTADFDTERIGLTSASLRVVPLTRDYQYATDQFNRYAKLAALQQAVNARRPMPEVQLTELQAGIDDFSRPLDYVDYARSVEDVLGLCMSGFPSFEQKTSHRRSLIYLGDSDVRRSGEQRPSLFSTAQIRDMAAAGGIQANVITKTAAQGSLQQLANGTGGRFEKYDTAAAVDASGDTNPALAGILDRIRANPPTAAMASANTVAKGSWDWPNVPLVAAVVVSALLSISLAVLRR
jgi:hypothetical protein